MNDPSSVPGIELAPGYIIPRIVLGAWQLSEGHRANPTNRAQAIEVFAGAAASGLLCVDCADIYTGVEDLLGEVRRRVAERYGSEVADGLRVHTKFVPDRSDLASVDKDYVRRIIDRSLERLGVERLDLVQFSWWAYDVPGYVETGLWLDELRSEGKIRLVGATNFDTPRLREIVDAGVSLVAHQVQYSLLDRRPEAAMVDFCQDKGIGLLCYGSLAGGYLSDKWIGASAPSEPYPNRSLRKYALVIEECGGWDRFQDLLHRLNRIARTNQASIAQVAIAWLIGRAGVVAPIVGASRLDRLLEASRALKLTLAPEDVAELDGWGREGPGLPGDCFGLERDPEGPHGRIMKYNLNKA